MAWDRDYLTLVTALVLGEIKAIEDHVEGLARQPSSHPVIELIKRASPAGREPMYLVRAQGSKKKFDCTHLYGLGLSQLEDEKDAAAWLDYLSCLGLYRNGKFDPAFNELLALTTKQTRIAKVSGWAGEFGRKSLPFLTKGELRNPSLAIALVEQQSLHWAEAADYLLCWASDEMISAHPDDLHPYGPRRLISNSSNDQDVLLALQMQGHKRHLAKAVLDAFGDVPIRAGLGFPAGARLCYTKASFLTSFQCEPVCLDLLAQVKAQACRYFPMGVLAAMQPDHEMRRINAPTVFSGYQSAGRFIASLAELPEYEALAVAEVKADDLSMLARKVVEISAHGASVIGLKEALVCQRLGAGHVDMRYQITEAEVGEYLAASRPLLACSRVDVKLDAPEKFDTLQKRIAVFQDILRLIHPGTHVDGIRVSADPKAALSEFSNFLKKNTTYGNPSALHQANLRNIGAESLVPVADGKAAWDALFLTFGDEGMQPYLDQVPDATVTQRMVLTLDI
ncbi:hypothetical protein HNP46_000466 [Pseudomonas nitritireducens]|uniref:Uncharacterized protein n=1 Tax=Pseudomonas nitroreducens TaxID=46680 RepID=A0A7W7KF06_PSENT|nr:hypothetical protein [Pseudomonas nitritireducens]MBB4861655.1 hypothetical protein [Pseudomonas nitritireducens]